MVYAKLVLYGLLVAFAGEFYNNIIVLKGTILPVLVSVPVYLIYFSIAYRGLGYRRMNIRIPGYSLLAGLAGLIIVEYFIIGKLTEPWPIHIFMFSWWVSIFTYPIVIEKNSYTPLIFPFIISVAAAITAALLWSNGFLALSVFANKRAFSIPIPISRKLRAQSMISNGRVNWKIVPT